MSNELTEQVKELVKEDSVLQGMVIKFNKYCKARSGDEIYKHSSISYELIKEQAEFRRFLLELAFIPKGKGLITE